MKYTVYNPKDGIVYAVLDFTDKSDLKYNVPEGHKVVEGDYPGNLYYFTISGMVKPFPPNPDTNFKVFDRITEQWVMDESAISNNSAEVIEYNRNIRNKLLDDSDKYLISDYPITEEKRQEWREYRTKLRDMTDFLRPLFPQIP